MHNRETGAAHVPIIFFLLLLVMFLGALGYAYTMQANNGELTQQRNDAQEEAKTLRSKSLITEHYIEDIGKIIGKPGKYEGRGANYNGATIEFAGLMNPAEVKKLMDDALAAVNAASASSLENVLGSLVTAVSQKNQSVDEIKKELAIAQDAKKEIDKKFTEATTVASDKAKEYSQNIDQSRSDFETAKQTKDATIASLTDGLRVKNDELTTSREEAVKKEKDLNNEITKRNIQVSAMVEKQRLRNPPDVADGKMMVARSGVATAFINLGRKDLLQPGTMFRVKNPNSQAVKGYATVTRIEEERAEVTLSNFTDPVSDYAQEGDLLFNDLFTPRATRTIYLMGRFVPPYNKPELTTLLKRLGNKVVDKMAPGVDTVILGNDPVNEAGDGFTKVAESEEYKLAHSLNAEFTYLTTIRDLLK